MNGSFLKQMRLIPPEQRIVWKFRINTKTGEHQDLFVALSLVSRRTHNYYLSTFVSINQITEDLKEGLVHNTFSEMEDIRIKCL